MKNKLLILSLGIICNLAIGQTNISGTVLDDTNTPLLGATLQLRGTKIGAVSDENGFFELKNIRVGRYDLVVSSLGYLTRTIPLDVSRNQSLSL